MRLTRRLLGDVSKTLKVLDFFSQYNPSPLSIKQFIDFGQNACERKSFLFLRKELPVRLANIMKEISLLPENLQHMPSVEMVQSWYVQSFADLVTFVKVEGDNEDDLNRFCETLDRVKDRHRSVVETMAQGVMEMRDSHGFDNTTENSIQYFLDRLYMSRIGIRMLINQHSLLFGKNIVSPSKHIGSIDPSCNVVGVLKDAYDNARFLCDQYYMDSPDLEINMNNGSTLPQVIEMCYVPSHLYHILFELFKNSMRAVMECHVDAENHPSIKATVCLGTEDVTIKISDAGGGIPRSRTDLLFQYLYSTAPRPDSSDVNVSAPLAGYGYGLPLSRLYARYFQGDLQLYSSEGYGSDAMVYLKALSSEANELLPVFNKTTTKFYKQGITMSDWTSSQSVYSNGNARGFSAQAVRSYRTGPCRQHCLTAGAALV
ncbi:PREDICTED: pyruvate dehydrogenase (acetyl-transferring) kinase, mitochondrial-like [Priapulus caudatus]|uniref:Protein-serine/threonine kinase n=1 Tax=Priapulus caudatus TaxID=37621 RepID=A0ABM1EY50_PRICU|nr:PREDICTED: pyruvate dehydrogenase (acetyl-transferring) kinase, mitochondrial-like [Priapulus caudatus]